MLPCWSADILASASRRAAPRRTPSGFGGDFLSFAGPSTPGLSGTALVGDRNSVVGTGSSQRPSGAFVQPTTTFDSHLGPQRVDGQQERATCGRRNQSRSCVDAGTMLACSVLSLDPNKHFLYSSMPLSDPSIARRGVGSHSSRMSRTERIEKALGLLKDGRLSPFDLVLEVLDDENAKYTGYRNELYKVGNQKLSKILDSILATDSGKQKLWSWMRPHALKIVCEVIDEEMDSVTKEELLPGISAITPDFIKSWAVADVCERAPFLTEVLLRAVETSRAKENNKKKHPAAVCIALSLMHPNTDILQHRCAMS